MSVTQRNNVPLINGSRGKIRVEHSEIVTTQAVTDALDIQTYRLIPSFPPWLKGVAKNFSKFKWITLKAVWRPTCPDNTLGSIHMGLVYDAFDTLPGNVQQISSMQGYASGAIWAGQVGSVITDNPRAKCPPGAICSELDVNRLEKKYYCYREVIGSSLVEVQQAVPASLVIAVEGGVKGSTAAVGHIHWSYVIECYEPTPAALNA